MDVSVYGGLRISGISTFDSHVDINNTVDVLGISTFQDRVIFDNTNSIQIPVGTTAVERCSRNCRYWSNQI